MGCFTRIKTKKGTEISIATQRYVVGHYICVTIGNTPCQGTAPKKYETYVKYHKKVREEAEQVGDEFLAEQSTSLEGLKYADKQFEKENAEYLDKPKKINEKYAI